MSEPPAGEVTCSVHLSATVKQLMNGDGGALLQIREIQNNTNPVIWWCSCRLAAEFHLVNVGRDEDEPFPMFRRL